MNVWESAKRLYEAGPEASKLFSQQLNAAEWQILATALKSVIKDWSQHDVFDKKTMEALMKKMEALSTKVSSDMSGNKP